MSSLLHALWPPSAPLAAAARLWQDQDSAGRVLLVLGLALLLSACRGLLRAPRRDRALLLGSGPLALRYARALGLRREIVGVVDEPPPDAGALGCLPLLGPPDRLREIVRQCRPDRLVVAQTNRRGHLPVEALLELRLSGLIVEDAIDACESATGQVELESPGAGSGPVGVGFRVSRFQQGLAQATSLACAALGLLVLAPLFCLISIAIRVDSAGPALFRQQRIGLGGRTFELLRFRSAGAGDRPTRVGALLRRFRLDELPQLVNVLRGEMNLVGPRPHPLANYDLFARLIPFYGLRYAVKPGLTGWAQVRSRSASDLGGELERMRYDFYYIKHRSAWLDLSILGETLGAALSGRGEAGAGCRALGDGI